MGTLYENIKELCDSKGIKPGKMCVDTGVSKGLISDLKVGRKKSIKVETAQKIASYFDVSVDAVIGDNSLAAQYEDISYKNVKIKTAPLAGGGINPDYVNLSPENLALVNQMIDQLLKSK